MKKKRLTLRQKRAITGLLFILPWFIGFLVYYVKSLFQTVQFSLSSIKIASTGGYTIQFIGLDNYKNALLENPDFNVKLFETITQLLTNLPFIIFFSLFMAMLLNSKFKGRALVRAIFFLPILLGSGAIYSTLQLATQNIQGGAAATVSDMQGAGGVNIDYIIEMLMNYGFPQSVRDTIIMLVASVYYIVRLSSIQIIIFIAALQSISPSLYEVSKIEGATSYETFWKITFPMVSPLILTNVVYTIVDYFITSNVVNLAYQVAFGGALDYGLSSAMSVISTVIVSLILVIIGGVISKFTFYYN